MKRLAKLLLNNHCGFLFSFSHEKAPKRGPTKMKKKWTDSRRRALSDDEKMVFPDDDDDDVRTPAAK